MEICNKHQIISKLYDKNDSRIIVNYLINKCECDKCSMGKIHACVNVNDNKPKITCINDNNAYFIYQSWMDTIKTRILKETKIYNYYINNKLYRDE